MSNQAIKLSDNAAKIKFIMSKAEKSAIGVRVELNQEVVPVCLILWSMLKEIKPNEEIIVDKGVKVLIDPNAIMFLLGTEMDYKEEKFSSQFVFKNPNETERCGCGRSFKV